MQNILKILPEGVIVFDKDLQKIKYANNMSQKLLEGKAESSNNTSTDT